MPEVDIAPEDPALILYTSGSTGHPKGVLSNHRNVVVALMAWEVEYGALAVRTGESVSPPEGSPNGPATLLGIPLFHVLGLHGVFLASFRSQRKTVAMLKWDPAIAAELIERERIITFTGPPAITGDLVREARRAGRDLSSLLTVGGGGAARAPEQVRQIDDTFDTAIPNTGWGMTETNAIGTLIVGAEYTTKPLSSGPPLCVIDIRVVGDDGAPVPSGQRGELQVRGPSMFREYWNKPDATASSFAEGGWFRTGDVAVIDHDGHLFIVDRIKDLIIRGGENVSPREVEEFLYTHPDIVDVQVIGVPDPRFGEAVCAAVRPRPGATVDLDSIQGHCRGRIAHFKVPQHVIVVDEFPMTVTGKIQKYLLREHAVEVLGLTGFGATA
jgi:long-chain acyl-CoA synthetase